MKRILNYTGFFLILLGFLGWMLGDPIFGYFFVNSLQIGVYFVTGAALVWSAMKGVPMMKMTSRTLGFVFSVLAIWGYAMKGDFFDLMTLNMPDHVLHALLAAIFVYFGFFGQKQAQPTQA